MKILYSGNRVYNNWNFMEFCNGPLEGSTEDVYGLSLIHISEPTRPY